jgi:RHS repeat-associated protein
MTGYIYDAQGNRVAKGTITSMSCDPTANGFTFTENYVLGPSGEELSMFDGGNNWQRTNVYAGSKLVGTYDTAGLHFHLEDPLGTRRMQVSGNPNQVGVPETDIQSWPYGDQLYSFPDQYAPATTDDATPLHFTGKERDAESGNDYFGARYYNPQTGRFISEDPIGLAAGPNEYAYVGDSPLNFIDPLGMDKKQNIFSCASEFATKYSIAGGLQSLGIGTSGVGGFVTNALGGNAFSGLTDLVQSFATGEGGGHSVFYNMGQGIVAGPTQGFGAAFGNSIKGTPWASGPADLATEAITGGTFNAVTGAGETVQTINGAASLASVGADAVEDFATGIGILKLIYGASSYGVGLVHCY